MFFENELTRTLTLIELLLAILVGLAPIAVTIWVKLVLYGRRVAEDKKGSPAYADHQPHGAAESAGVLSADTALPVFQGRQPRMIRKLPEVFDRNRPLELFVPNPAAERLMPKMKKEKRNGTAIC